MSLETAHAFAFSLATTLMAVIVIFRAGDGTLSVMPASEYDGDSAAIAASKGFAVATRDPSAFHAAGLEVIDPWATVI